MALSQGMNPVRVNNSAKCIIFIEIPDAEKQRDKDNLTRVNKFTQASPAPLDAKGLHPC